MNDTQPSIGVYFKGEAAPVVRKPSWWDWISFYVFNFLRKPLVALRQNELQRIFWDVKKSLRSELLDELFSRVPICEDCKNAYMALAPQVFLSQIKSLLSAMKCPDHPRSFEVFLLKHYSEFLESERISKWINNL